MLLIKTKIDECSNYPYLELNTHTHDEISRVERGALRLFIAKAKEQGIEFVCNKDEYWSAEIRIKEKKCHIVIQK